MPIPPLREESSNFRTTLWDLVAGVANGDAKISRASLEDLCRIYWRPVYGFVRSQGWGEADAADLTQEFMGSVISGKLLERADPAKGRLRDLLRGAVRRFLVTEARRRNTQRRRPRGGEVSLASLGETGENLDDTLDAATPDTAAYDRAWAEETMEETWRELCARDTGRPGTLSTPQLWPWLIQPDQAGDFDALCREHGIEVGTGRVQLSRRRERLGRVLRRLVQQTVATDADVESEVAYLLRAFSS